MAGYSNTRSLRAAVDREREKIGIIQYSPARRDISFLLWGIVELEKCGSLSGAQMRGPLLGLVLKIGMTELNQQNSDSGNVNASEKRRIQFVISGGDPTKPFELLEEAFNQMALFI